MVASMPVPSAALGICDSGSQWVRFGHGHESSPDPGNWADDVHDNIGQRGIGDLSPTIGLGGLGPQSRSLSGGYAVICFRVSYWAPGWTHPASAHPRGRVWVMPRSEGVGAPVAVLAGFRDGRATGC